jgi:hypothetical protein
VGKGLNVKTYKDDVPRIAVDAKSEAGPLSGGSWDVERG